MSEPPALRVRRRTPVASARPGTPELAQRPVKPALPTLVNASANPYFDDRIPAAPPGAEAATGAAPPEADGFAQHTLMGDALPHDHVWLATEHLEFGMFVAGLDRPWREAPFAVQGFIIEDRRQLDALRLVCNEVVIDRSRSSADSTAHLKPAEPPPPRRRKRLLAALATVFRNARELAGAAPPAAPRPTESATGRSGLAAPPITFSVIRRGDEQRLELLNASTARDGTRATVVDLKLPKGMTPVEYPDDTTIEDALVPARTAYVKIESTMRTIIIDLAQNREISADAVTGAANELVEIITMNSEAMMWLARIRARNALAYAKSVQVAVYTGTLGRHLGFPREHLRNLCLSALLLDVGLMRVDKRLLAKTGPLTEDEMAQIRCHVDHGLDMLAGSSNVDSVAREGVAQHHERIDGSGYPLGLVGDEISIVGRIAGIADTFAALTAQRPYAKPESVFNAMKVLLTSSGKKFHEPLVEQFVRAIGLFPVGSLVELSTGEVAAVVTHNKVRRLQPRVLLLTSADKKMLPVPVSLNLLDDPVDAEGNLIRIWRGLPPNAYGIGQRDYFLS